ncbi:MAG: helix-turn-helix transcriptional regulator [Nonomuraea sp.]|nr:helix-turn-helix transcriptional regulator [Nonomuraea sp.]
MSERANGQPPGHNFWDWLSRTATGLGYQSDAALARALNVSPSTVLRWRQGSRPTIRHLLNISDVMGVRLEPLLVLSGHAPANAIGDAEPPPPPESVTPTERIIMNAALDEHLQAIMTRYWQYRIEEERRRVHKLINLLMANPVPLSEKGFSTELGEIMESRLPAHVSDVVVQWAHYRTSQGRSERK